MVLCVTPGLAYKLMAAINNLCMPPNFKASKNGVLALNASLSAGLRLHAANRERQAHKEKVTRVPSCTARGGVGQLTP